MLICSSKGKLTRLTESYLLRPSGEPGYLYTRVMLNDTLAVELQFTGRYGDHLKGSSRQYVDQDEIMITLFVMRAVPGHLRICDTWRRRYTSKDLLSKDTQSYSMLEVLDMSLADVERTKLEDLQLFIDDLDNIDDDAPDALEKIQAIAEDNDMLLIDD